MRITATLPMGHDPGEEFTPEALAGAAANLKGRSILFRRGQHSETAKVLDARAGEGELTITIEVSGGLGL